MEFGVDDSLRNDAGLYGGGVSVAGTATRKGVVAPPPGLGDEDTDTELDDKEHGTEQRKTQPAVRVYDRAGGPRRSPGDEGDR